MGITTSPAAKRFFVHQDLHLSGAERMYALEQWHSGDWDLRMGFDLPKMVPSGYLTVCHGQWPIYRWFTGLPIKNGDFGYD